MIHYSEKNVFFGRSKIVVPDVKKGTPYIVKDAVNQT